MAMINQSHATKYIITYPFVYCKDIPSMKKTYKRKTNHGDFSQLAHIATQVWDLDLEIKHTHNFAAKWTKNSTPFSHLK